MHTSPISNSEMESAEQYIKLIRYRDSDRWSTNFLNKNGLSMNEINEIVSPFVKRKRINQILNNDTCFINLFSLEDAVKCVEGLRGHKLIQLRKQLRNRGQSKQNNEINQSDLRYDEMYKSDVDDNGMFNNESKNDRYNKENGFISNHSVDATEPPKQFNESITNSPAKIVIDTNTNEKSNKEFQEEKSVEVEPEMPKLILKKNSSESSSKDTTVESTYFEDENYSSIKTLEAEELIIANIDENYGTNYILHLLEKYQPICASFVKVSERYSLRYCHIYFTSNQYIHEIKKKFDNFELGLKNLMVLYVNRSKGIPILE